MPPDSTRFEEPLRRAFAGKRILVTGHTGFKGGWLCLWLKRLGAEVIGIALPPPPGDSLFSALRLEEQVDHRIADIRCAADYAAACRGAGADVVFHLAAQSLVRSSYAAPAHTFSTNVLGTAHVLDAVRTMDSTRAAIVVTTDKCYENHEWCWPYRETDRLGGSDPYSASKACAELVSASYRRSFFSGPGACRLATARAGNVFGGGDWAVDRLIPDIVRAAVSGTAVEIRNPASVRPWQHVLEPLAGYLTLGAGLLADDGSTMAEAWNFGPRPDDFISVGQMARNFADAWGAGAPQIRFGLREGDPHEAGMLTLDSSKAHSRLGWRPRLAAERAVAMTADWYRNQASSEDMRAFTLAQIAAFAAGDEDNSISQPNMKEALQCA